jgi:hypothetical protein
MGKQKAQQETTEGVQSAPAVEGQKAAPQRRPGPMATGRRGSATAPGGEGGGPGMGAAMRARGSRAMQRQAGNARLSRPSGGTVQAKLSVNQPGDPFEQEADRVADQVMRASREPVAPRTAPAGPAGDIVQTKSAVNQPGAMRDQRAGAPPMGAASLLRPRAVQGIAPATESPTNDQTKSTAPPRPRTASIAPAGQTKTTATPPSQRLSRLPAQGAPGQAAEVGPGVEDYVRGARGGGQPLPASVRGTMEPHFGQDLSGVRVHDGPGANRAAEELNARAFTSGQDIHFGAGEYRPNTPQGERLIAHELSHVVQQNGNQSGRPPGELLQAQNQPRPSMYLPGDTLIVGFPDTILFPRTPVFDRRWDILPETFVPLAEGTFIVDMVPISYHLGGRAEASSYAALIFGPGTLEDGQIYVTGAEAERMRHPGYYVIPSIPPLILPRSRPRYPTGEFGADAMMRFTAMGRAGVSANARLEAGLGVFLDTFNAGAFAGLSGSASAYGFTRANTYVSFRWNNGVRSFSAGLDLEATLRLAFSVNAFAGVWVELRFPDIPVVTDLTHEVQDWPIIGWVVPDLSEWRWRKEYRTDWPVLDKTYEWNLQEHFDIFGAPPAARATGSMINPTGFSISQLLQDLQAKQRAGELRDDPEGPGSERRSSEPAEVAEERANAFAQISSAERAARRELRANTRLRRNLPRPERATGPTGAAAPSLAIASGPGPDDPAAELEEREEKLDDAVQSTQELREKVRALDEPARAPDGVSRNQARAGYESIAENADTLGDKIDQGEEPFDIPGAVEPDTADYERMREKRNEAYDAFDEAYDPTRTEKLWADSRVEAAANVPDLEAYSRQIAQHRRQAAGLWQRIQKLERDLETAREWYERHDHGLGVVVFGELKDKAVFTLHLVEDLRSHRPAEEWDTEFVELTREGLMLRPEYRGKAVRRTFYPHDYSADTQRRKLAEIGRFRTDPDGTMYWEYRQRQSPRGDHWWLMHDDLEQPTLDHLNPTVVGHWNYGGAGYHAGRRVDRAARRRYYDFVGAPLVVVPKTLNSSAGGREPASYIPRVFKTFRGR